MSPFAPGGRRVFWLGLLLAALTVATLWPATANGFVEFDDLAYVNDNPHVLGGLAGSNVWWALTTTEMGNWHPLTWLSLMLDAELWHGSAWGFHLTNLLLHVCTVVVLFTALLWLTGATQRSALVAALFAVHPLNVETVAWVAERKGLLAALFAVLTLAAYARYATRGGRINYAAVMLFFALSLMAKAVTVALPAALLLLDYWPLRRTPVSSQPGDRAPASWRRLLLEKVPLLILSVAFGVLASLAQRGAGALRTVEQRPLDGRLANTLVNPLIYLRRLCWPSDLAVFYPYVRRTVLAPEIIASAVALLALTAAVLWAGRRRPYLPVGWLWYVGMLLPVAGLVPVGGHSLADRYAYLPMIGLLVILVWGTADLLTAVHLRGAALPLAAGTVAACVLVTREQLPHWQDAVTLWEQALRVTRDNHRAYYNLGAHYLNAGQTDLAVPNLAESVRLRPEKADWRLVLGRALARQGNLDEARAQLEQALRTDPDLAEAANELRNVVARQAAQPAPPAEPFKAND
jgi:hypothetical protein